MRLMRALLRPGLAALTLPLAAIASAGLPPPVARAFAEQHIPLAASPDSSCCDPNTAGRLKRMPTER
jgi:hypothetical protein